MAQDWPHALAETAAALKDDPACEFALFLRAFALWKLGQSQRALETIENVRGVAVETDRVAVEHLRMLILIACGKMPEAAAITRRAATRFQSAAILWIGLSELERRSNKPISARLAALHAYQADPSHPGAMMQMAGYCLEVGDTDQARRLITLLPDPSQAKFVKKWAILGLSVGIGDPTAIADAMRYPKGRRPPNLMWRVALTLSAFPNAEVRDGKRALEVLNALRMPSASNKHYAVCRAIEAAAHAEAGQWDEAIAAVDEGSRHARDEEMRAKLSQLRQMFARRVPYRLDLSKGANQLLYLSYFESIEPD